MFFRSHSCRFLVNRLDNAWSGSFKLLCKEQKLQQLRTRSEGIQSTAGETGGQNANFNGI